MNSRPKLEKYSELPSPCSHFQIARHTQEGHSRRSLRSQVVFIYSEYRLQQQHLHLFFCQCILSAFHLCVQVSISPACVGHWGRHWRAKDEANMVPTRRKPTVQYALFALKHHLCLLSNTGDQENKKGQMEPLPPHLDTFQASGVFRAPGFSGRGQGSHVICPSSFWKVPFGHKMQRSCSPSSYVPALQLTSQRGKWCGQWRHRSRGKMIWVLEMKVNRWHWAHAPPHKCPKCGVYHLWVFCAHLLPSCHPLFEVSTWSLDHELLRSRDHTSPNYFWEQVLDFSYFTRLSERL